MDRPRSAFVSLLLTAAAASAAFGAPRDPAQAHRRGWEFQRLAEHKLRFEPYLHHDSRWAAQQEWTLRYQKFGTDMRTSGTVKRLFVYGPSNVRLAQFERAWVEYGKAGSALLDEIFPHIAIQRAMNPGDKAFDREYVAKINLAFFSMLPRPDGRFNDYHPHDCDFISQPLNALWYSVNQLILIDEYAESVFPDRWPARRERLRAEHRIKELDEFRRRIEAGVPSPD